MLIQIEKDDWWPESIRERVMAHQDKLLKAEFMENLIEREPFLSIARDLEEFIRKQKIVCYHCTKEPEKGYFEEHGLRILDLKNHQAEFIKQYQHIFSLSELAEIKQAWVDYFDYNHGEQEKIRRNQLHFCFTSNLVVESGIGTEIFFKYFGGEAIFMPLKRHKNIAAKLNSIGNPVVVEVELDPNKFNNSPFFVPFAINSLGLFHRRINPNAFPHNREGHIKENVPSKEVLKVTPKDLFFSENTYDR